MITHLADKPVEVTEYAARVRMSPENIAVGAWVV